MTRLSLKKRGFTLVELMIAISISVLLFGLGLTTFISFTKHEALDAGAAAIAGGLRDARAQTLASVGGSQYGVYIEPEKFTVFKGSSFTSGAAGNDLFFLSSHVRVNPSIPTFVFQRLTGNAVSGGTIEVYLASDPSSKRIITVGATGLVNIQ